MNEVAQKLLRKREEQMANIDYINPNKTITKWTLTKTEVRPVANTPQVINKERILQLSNKDYCKPGVTIKDFTIIKSELYSVFSQDEIDTLKNNRESLPELLKLNRERYYGNINGLDKSCKKESKTTFLGNIKNIFWNKKPKEDKPRNNELEFQIYSEEMKYNNYSKVV